jgi:predicted nucleotidyltransferase
MELNQDLKEFLSLLASNEVRFMIVGGAAVNAYGLIRGTEDLDCWIAHDRANAERVLRALDAFGMGSIGLIIDDLTERGKVIMLGRKPNRLDILTSISGREFEDCYQRRRYLKLDGVELPFIALPDLLANKRATGRPKDLGDVEEFEKSAAPPK